MSSTSNYPYTARTQPTPTKDELNFPPPNRHLSVWANNSLYHAYPQRTSLLVEVKEEANNINEIQTPLKCDSFDLAVLEWSKYIKYEIEVRSLEYWSKPHNFYLTSTLILLYRKTNQQAPWVLILKKKKNQKNTKTLQNSLAKAPKMQRELKYLFWQKNRSHCSDKKKQTNTKAKWNGRQVCIKFRSCFHFKTFSCPTDCDPCTKTCRAFAFDPWWMKTVTNYWILSFHWRVNEKHWQTRNSCDALLVQSLPAVPDGNVVLISRRSDCWHAQKFNPGWDST